LKKFSAGWEGEEMGAVLLNNEENQTYITPPDGPIEAE
jgi:hypothetical protein